MLRAIREAYSRIWNVDGAYRAVSTRLLVSKEERGRSYLNRVPVFASERILGSLLETLLALGQALIPAPGQCPQF